jgi:hypothetical protein
MIGENWLLPILIAGDVFDDGWRPHRCPPELINWVLGMLPPRCYAIPGQHDLPHHRYDDIERSAYWTLVKAGKVINVPPAQFEDGFPQEFIEIPTTKGRVLRLHGFPWGHKPMPLERPHDMAIDIALVHKYIWTKKTGYEGAKVEDRLMRLSDSFRGYDVVVVGDNHTPFDAKLDHGAYVYNCGTFIRRRMVERAHWPSIGIIYSDGSVKRQALNIGDDKFTPQQPGELKQEGYFDDVIASLGDLGQSAMDYAAAVIRTMDHGQVSDGLRQRALAAMGGDKK